MAVSGSDTYGAFLDTGINTQPTIRASVETESHSALETDSGSKNTVVQTIASHVPHRPVNSPR